MGGHSLIFLPNFSNCWHLPFLFHLYLILTHPLLHPHSLFSFLFFFTEDGLEASKSSLNHYFTHKSVQCTVSLTNYDFLKLPTMLLSCLQFNSNSIANKVIHLWLLLIFSNSNWHCRKEFMVLCYFENINCHKILLLFQIHQLILSANSVKLGKKIELSLY